MKQLYIFRAALTIVDVGKLRFFFGISKSNSQYTSEPSDTHSVWTKTNNTQTDCRERYSWMLRSQVAVDQLGEWLCVCDHNNGILRTEKIPNDHGSFYSESLTGEFAPRTLPIPCTLEAFAIAASLCRFMLHPSFPIYLLFLVCVTVGNGHWNCSRLFFLC